MGTGPATVLRPLRLTTKECAARAAKAPGDREIAGLPLSAGMIRKLGSTPIADPERMREVAEVIAKAPGDRESAGGSPGLRKLGSAPIANPQRGGPGRQVAEVIAKAPG